MVYWTRRTAGLEDLSVWGIVTDSHTWEFIHIRADGTVRPNFGLVWKILFLTNSLVYVEYLQLQLLS